MEYCGYCEYSGSFDSITNVKENDNEVRSGKKCGEEVKRTFKFVREMIFMIDAVTPNMVKANITLICLLARWL